MLRVSADLRGVGIDPLGQGVDLLRVGADLLRVGIYALGQGTDLLRVSIYPLSQGAGLRRQLQEFLIQESLPQPALVVRVAIQRFDQVVKSINPLGSHETIL